jgi:hypothetical protein
MVTILDKLAVLCIEKIRKVKYFLFIHAFHIKDLLALILKVLVE